MEDVYLRLSVPHYLHLVEIVEAYERNLARSRAKYAKQRQELGKSQGSSAKMKDPVKLVVVRKEDLIKELQESAAKEQEESAPKVKQD